LLHLTSPGIPDLYQGDELWNLALVDPDNRRPVDYVRRVELLDEIEREWQVGGDSRLRYLGDLARRPEDGRLKLHLIRAALAARRARPAAFASSVYLPLAPQGPAADRVIAFGRGGEDERMIVAVPRHLGAWLASAGSGPTDPALWQDAVLPIPPGWPVRWTSALTGEVMAAESGGLRLASLFGVLPAALLLADQSPS
jgi:(1->4)-alpha-D-glucan 1-alpha-D-glucosylmutase